MQTLNFNNYSFRLKNSENKVYIFDAIRKNQNMRIIILGHSQIKTVQNLLGNDYDSYMPNIRDKHCDLLKAWCDIVGYLHTKTYTDISKGSFGKDIIKTINFYLENICEYLDS